MLCPVDILSVDVLSVDVLSVDVLSLYQKSHATVPLKEKCHKIFSVGFFIKKLLPLLLEVPYGDLKFYQMIMEIFEEMCILHYVGTSYK